MGITVMGIFCAPQRDAAEEHTVMLCRSPTEAVARHLWDLSVLGQFPSLWLVCGPACQVPAPSRFLLPLQPWSKWREEHMSGERLPNVIIDFWFSTAGSWIRPCRPSWPPISEGKAHVGDKPSSLSLLKAIKLQKTLYSWKNRWHLPVIGYNCPLFKERMKVGDQKSLCGMF